MTVSHVRCVQAVVQSSLKGHNKKKENIGNILWPYCFHIN